MTQHYWKAEVTLAGVPVLSEEDAFAMQGITPMIIRHEADSNRLFLVWRFPADSATISAAIERASYTWRAALGQAPGIDMMSPDVACTDFRVYRVASL